MEGFVVKLWSKYGVLPVTVKQLPSNFEECLSEYEVGFTYKGKVLHSTVTLDTSDWDPPLMLDDSEPETHYPKVFTFCHDGVFNHSDAQALGQAIMGHFDVQAEAVKREYINATQR